MNRMLYLLLLLSLVLCCLAAAQHSALAQTNPAVLGTVAGAPPPLPPSPVDTFRKILAMRQPEREKFLGTLSPEKRQVVMSKLEEYQRLPTDEREERLRALQVRVWVRQLIRLPASNRVERLAKLQPEEREFIEARLGKWDALSADTQKEVLASEIAIRHIANSPAYKFNPALPPFPPDARVATQLKHWNELSKARRTEVLMHFEYFLEEFTPNQRVQILAERPDMRTALAPLAKMSKEERDRYLDGFKRFAALTPVERQRFLVNAARWEKMTPEERESWRILARKLTPSSPPPPPSRPSAAVVPTASSAAVDLPSR